MYKRSLLSTLAIMVFTSFAAHAEIGLGDVFDSKLYLSGYTGDDLLGRADLIIPFLRSSDRTMFVYGQSRVSNNDADKTLFSATPWTATGGVGFRQIVKDSTLLGGFVLIDYSQSDSGNYFWDISPGIEALGKVWDFRANGYFPISEKSYSKEGFADQFGIYDYTQFSAHEQYNQWLKYRFSQKIANGCDTEVGRKLFKVNNVLVKGYLGGYYFNMKNSGGLTGGNARITVQPSEFVEFSANDTYDHVSHNTFMLGMRLRLNDIFSKHPQHDVIEDHDLRARLLDPIERNLGNLGSGNMHYASQSELTHQGKRLERDHIWFFDGTKTANGSGTYEDPYSFLQYQQTTINSLHNVNPDYANMYFNSGNYQSDLSENNSIASNSAVISLYASESMWGRTGAMKGYAKPAIGNNRAILIGGLQLASNNTINDLVLHNSLVANLPVGVLLDNTQNVVINDVDVGSANDDNIGYHTGISLINNSSLTLNDSQIYGYNANVLPPNSNAETVNGIGIEANNGSTLATINDTTIEGTSVYGGGYGFYDNNDSGNIVIGNINNSTFIGNGILAGIGFNAITKSWNVSIGDITNSNFVGILNPILAGNYFGLFTQSTYGNVQVGNISQSNFSGNANLHGNTLAYGGGFGAETQETGNVLIGNITNSNFTGIANMNGDTNVAINVGLFTETKSGSVKIGNITKSSLIGSTTVNGNGDFTINVGLFAEAIKGKTTSQPYGVTIGNIQGSTLSGLNTVTSGEKNTLLGFGVYGETDSQSIIIGSIYGSTFSGTGNFMADSLGLNSPKVYVNNNLLVDQNGLNNYLTRADANNSLVGAVCVIQGGCAPPLLQLIVA